MHTKPDNTKDETVPLKPKLKQERINLVEEAIKQADNELIKERLEKLKHLLMQDIEPYPYKYNIDAYSTDIIERYANLKIADSTKDFYHLAGRIFTIRRMGGLTFMHLLDGKGKIQLCFKQDVLDKAYKFIKKLNIGDFIGVYGNVFKTKTGEITINVHKFMLLAKATRPLPEKWHGLKNIELRYRKRYLDLIMNPESKKRFITRTKIIKAIREFLDSKGFIEVETPILQPVYGGANARPFITHHHDLNIDVYLRISDELYLKRLIIAGFDKVYEIGKDFRNESIDRTHNPEFSQLEFYQAYADYNDMMELCEDLYLYVAKKVLGKTKFRYGEHEIDLKKPWKRLTMIDALKLYAGLDIENLSDDDIKRLLAKHDIELDAGYNKGLAIQELFEKLVEDKLIQPVFIIDHPKETTPLCKWHRTKSGFVERFEPYIAGMEVANGYSELNDPLVQKKLFEEQAARRTKGEKDTHPYDADFIEAMEYGMPPTGGLGVGIDRMVMLFTNAHSIRDVILFPTLRPDKQSDKQ